MSIRITRWLAIIAVGLFVLTLSLIGPIDRTSLSEQAFYKAMDARLDTLQPSPATPDSPLKAGWAKVSITPAYSMPMAGYTPRDHFENVHDSLFARVIVLDNGSMTSIMISVDLLLFPPLLKELIDQNLVKSRIGNFFLYPSATHTHNGIGGWDDSILGRYALGTYHEEWVEATAAHIVDAILAVSPIPSSISYWEADASGYVENRIAFEHGEIDGKLRGIVITREDAKKAFLFSFSAHPTSIRKESLELSGDYPAEVIRQLQDSFDFGMFMSGMVGSHRFKSSPQMDYDFIARAGVYLAQKIQTAAQGDANDSIPFKALHVPISFGPSQMRINKNWRLRDWLFRTLSRPLQGELTYLELGDVVFIGTPCDFSGEIYARDGLEKFASNYGKHLIITSFNGDYNGYITFDGHYETLNKEEVRAMNWVGPYYGEYFSHMIKRVMEQEFENRND